ncbi:hypothetical protein E2C01_036075 [Portunus trituberculatus]|uniref:Uncharacterized protein n=1 Tax=Portunus trituberculatus TaxID=210409 RepID=A0A5B7FBG6_PORTR|nr:hypothetical protein [Portunus trituberculatus]
MFFGQMPEVWKEDGVSKILTFSIYEGVFGKLKNRLGMILGRISLLLRFQHAETGL